MGGNLISWTPESCIRFLFFWFRQETRIDPEGFSTFKKGKGHESQRPVSDYPARVTEIFLLRERKKTLWHPGSDICRLQAADDKCRVTFDAFKLFLAEQARTKHAGYL